MGLEDVVKTVLPPLGCHLSSGLLMLPADCGVFLHFKIRDLNLFSL